MTELYITFFVIGLLVFAGIALFSWMQQSRGGRFFSGSKKTNKHGFDDPLFDENASAERSKHTVSPPNKQDGLGDSEKISPSFTSGQDTQSVDNSRLATDSQHKKINKESAKTNPVKRQKVKDGREGKTNSNRTSLPVVDMVSDQSSSEDTRMADNAEIINIQPKRDESSTSIVTELVARVKNDIAIEQKDLLSLFRTHDYKFHRKVHIYGLNQLTDLWCDVEYELPSARFVELGIAIQLADRDGGMSQKELHDFQQMALDFSNHFDAPFEFSMDIDEAMVQAKVLDQMGRRYDSMAVLNVVARSKAGFRSADIESCARDLGMARSKKGIFLKTTGQKHQISVLYRLACTSGAGEFGLSGSSTQLVHDLVIYMNVPATKTPEIVFQDMVKDANSLATWLDGKVVDRDGKVMTQRSYSVLTQQISDIAFSMQQDGLMPGDELSKKLF